MSLYDSDDLRRRADRLRYTQVFSAELHSLLDAITALTAQRDALRAFAHDLLVDWPDNCGLDGHEVQELAAKHGLLKPETRTAPCGEECPCAEYHGSDGMADGVTCYRKTALLTGKPENAA